MGWFLCLLDDERACRLRLGMPLGQQQRLPFGCDNKVATKRTYAGRPLNGRPVHYLSGWRRPMFSRYSGLTLHDSGVLRLVVEALRGSCEGCSGFATDDGVRLPGGDRRRAICLAPLRHFAGQFSQLTAPLGGGPLRSRGLSAPTRSRAGKGALTEAVRALQTIPSASKPAMNGGARSSLAGPSSVTYRQRV